MASSALMTVLSVGVKMASTLAADRASTAEVISLVLVPVFSSKAMPLEVR